MPKLAEIGGRRIPLLRWSVWRMMLGMKHLTTHWQVGDGREEALAEYVISTAPPGDLDDAIRAVDDFCYRELHDQRRGRGARSWTRQSAGPSRAGCSSLEPTAATARFGPPE